MTERPAADPARPRTAPDAPAAPATAAAPVKASRLGLFSACRSNRFACRSPFQIVAGQHGFDPPTQGSITLAGLLANTWHAGVLLMSKVCSSGRRSRREFFPTRLIGRRDFHFFGIRHREEHALEQSGRRRRGPAQRHLD